MKPKFIAEWGSSPARRGWDLWQWAQGTLGARAQAGKVQLFRAEHFPAAEQASKRALEFPRERLPEFVRVCHAHGIEAGASVFDAAAVDAAAEWCDWLKLAAREQRNTDLTNRAISTGKRLYRSISDPRCYRPGVATLATVQRYPLPMGAALLAVVRWAWFFRAQGVPWGWSSHTAGTADVRLAVRLGAVVIEKHLALWPDDLEAGHSLLVGDFADMVKELRK